MLNPNTTKSDQLIEHVRTQATVWDKKFPGIGWGLVKHMSDNDIADIINSLNAPSKPVTGQVAVKVIYQDLIKTGMAKKFMVTKD